VSSWTVDDALRIRAALAKWLPTLDGAKCAYAIGDTREQTSMANDISDIWCRNSVLSRIS
jgi:hypothetical protein